MRHFNSLMLLAFTAFLGRGPAAAQTADALMADANQLVRGGVYRTALLRYREAAAAGLDTPLLHYNLGVVQFELGNYRESADEFALAAGESSLTALASYNRGLALRAAGDEAAARDAFRAAAAHAGDRDLRRLATSAAEARDEEPEPRSAATTPRRAQRQPVADARVGELELSASARVGQDDNVYRSPSEAYIDLADAATPLVTPVVRSASFVPAELYATYVLENESGDTEFLFRYGMNGDFYGKEYSNATRVDQRASMGADIVLGEEGRRRREVATEVFVSSHRETNFDPDDGLARDIDGEDIADRFSYRASGVQGDFTHTLGRITWGFNLTFERDEYERAEAVANFDHELYYVGVDVDYERSDAMTLRFGLRRYRALYDERPARDLAGALLDTNPAQRYAYSGLRFGLTRRLGSKVELDADLLHLLREDEFVGYYDYTQDVLRVGFGFRPTPRFDVAVRALARSYDYERAFAFHVPAGGARELEELGVEIEAGYRITRRLALWAELESLDVTSTDMRAEFARTRSAIGVEWRK